MPGSADRGVVADTPREPVTRTQRRRLVTRERLVTAAMELFSEYGYHGTTMDMIADRADLARTTVFNHFPRKDILLLAALADRRRIVGDRLAQTHPAQTHPAQASTGPAGTGPASTGDRLRDAIIQWAAAYQADVRTGAALVRAWVEAGGPYLPGAADTAALFTAALSAGQQAGDVRLDVDVEAAGLVLLDAAVGALVRWAAGPPALPHRPGLQAAMLAAAEIVLPGLLTSPVPASPGHASPG